MTLWSDEDRLFVSRMLGWSINFKYIAKKLGLIKMAKPVDPVPREEAPPSRTTPETRLREAIERSRIETE